MAKLTGTNPEQVPTNADLGTIAYQDKDNLQVGRVLATSNGDAPAEFDRLTSNGDILGFYKDGTTVGSIGVNGDRIYLTNAQEGIMIDQSANNLSPTSSSGTFNDNAMNLGESGNRWKDLYLSGEIYSSTGLLRLDGNDIGGTQVTIADDAVASITPPRTGGFMFVTTSGNSDFPNVECSGAMLYYDVGVSLRIDKSSVFGSPIASQIDVTTSDVTGTTGTDNNITIAAQTDVLKIENRNGGSRTLQITFL